MVVVVVVVMVVVVEEEMNKRGASGVRVGKEESKVDNSSG
jgi:hypothetical protein